LSTEPDKDEGPATVLGIELEVVMEVRLSEDLESLSGQHLNGEVLTISLPIIIETSFEIG
jgi:hypothetical protein